MKTAYGVMYYILDIDGCKSRSSPISHILFINKTKAQNMANELNNDEKKDKTSRISYQVEKFMIIEE